MNDAEMSPARDSLLPATIESSRAGMIAREQAELQAAIVLARQCARDEDFAKAKIERSCRDPEFAAIALYRFPRGGGVIEGPSVRFARLLATAWGNIRYGVRIVAQDEHEVHVKGYAHDLEANVCVEGEDRFFKRVQRKIQGKTVWMTPDERDLRELVLSRGAKCVRNAILQILPGHLVAQAVRWVKECAVQGATKEIGQDRANVIRSLLRAFAAFDVDLPRMEAHLGHPLDAITPEELATMRQIYEALRDGEPANNYFGGPSPDAGQSRTGQLVQQVVFQSSAGPLGPPESLGSQHGHGSLPEADAVREPESKARGRKARPESQPPLLVPEVAPPGDLMTECYAASAQLARDEPLRLLKTLGLSTLAELKTAGSTIQQKFLELCR